jgi:hypothetical protein
MEIFMIDQVSVKQSRQDIRVRTRTNQGVQYDFVITAGNALIGERGLIQAFSVEWNDGSIRAYKLLPKHSTAREIGLWIGEFLLGYGLSRLGGKVIKGDQEVNHISRYTLGFMGVAHKMRSFVESHFLPEDLGYFDLVTENLVFPDGALYAPNGAW